MGTKRGFPGNHCYIENNVARICAYNIFIKRVLGYGKYIKSDTKKDPFDGNDEVNINSFSYREPNLIEIELFSKNYVFRQLNTTLGSNLQLFPQIISLIHKINHLESQIAILNMLINNTQEYSQIFLEGSLPLLTDDCSLETDISKCIEGYLGILKDL